VVEKLKPIDQADKVTGTKMIDQNNESNKGNTI
jgi:hypothetical protein